MDDITSFTESGAPVTCIVVSLSMKISVPSMVISVNNRIPLSTDISTVTASSIYNLLIIVCINLIMSFI